MPENTYTATISGNSMSELLRNTQAMVTALASGVRTTTADDMPAESYADPVNAEQETEGAAAGAAAQVPGRRRGRPPGSTNQASAASTTTSGNGADKPDKSTDEMRQEATDILKACWGKKNSPGAEKVIALQKKFGVTRFGEVSDDKVPTLLQAAVALQRELAGGDVASGGDTGPF